MVCGTPAEDVIESVKDSNSLVLASKVTEVGWISRDGSEAGVFEIPLARLGIDWNSEADSSRMDDPIADITVAECFSSLTVDD